MTFVGWVALGVGALLGQVVVNGQQIAASCSDLKRVVEDAGSSGEELVVRLGSDGPLLCDEMISISPGQSVHVSGGDDAMTVVLLNATGIWSKDRVGFEGQLFENSGTLHLEKIEFDLDYVDRPTPYDTRIVRNHGGNVSLTDCSFIGVEAGNSGQTFMMGQGVYSDGQNTAVYLGRVTYNDPSPAGSIVVSIGQGAVTIEDSTFSLGTPFPSGDDVGIHATTIYTGPSVNLDVMGSVFNPGTATQSAGMAISSHGGTIRDCTFYGQVTTMEGGGAVNSNVHLDSIDDNLLTIEGSSFEGNYAESGASSVAVHNSSLVIRDTEFVGNFAGAILFESWSVRGEHELEIEDCDFSKNRETIEGGQSKYGGGAAVVIRNNVAVEEAVRTGSFIDTFCEANEPSECEIMEMMVETEHDGDSDCRSCNSALEILAQEASASAHGSASSTSPISAFLECDDGGQTIETCSALKTEVEKNGGNCRFILQVDIICDEAITVSSGQTVVVDGLSDDRYSSISIDPDFKSPNEVEWKAKPSVFIVEDGGQLSLEHVGFNGTATKGTRVVHNYGNLRVDSCEWGGYSSTDRVEYGGAILSEPSAGLVVITSSSLSDFAASESGGAIYVGGNDTFVSITDGTFTGNEATTGAGGAIFASSVDIKESTFSNNAGIKGAAVYCCGGQVEGTTFVGGDLSNGALSNGGLRSGSPGSSRCSRELLVLDCSFSNNTATSSGDGDRGGSALQVFNTNVSVSNSDFAGNKGTAVYIETSYDGSDDSETYLVAIDSSSFTSNDEAKGDTSSPHLRLLGTAAVLRSKNNTELLSTGFPLQASCSNNVPYLCEIIVDTYPMPLEFEEATSCSVCDGNGNTIAGREDVEDFAFTTSSTTDSGAEVVTVVALSCTALKTAIERGSSGNFELLTDIDCNESITIVSGQSVTISAPEPADDPSLGCKIFASHPFTSANTGTDGPDGHSLFVVEEGGSLNIAGVTFQSSSGDAEGTVDDGVRAIYSAGNITVQRCTFTELSRANASWFGQVANGGAIYTDISVGGTAVVLESNFDENVVSGNGGAIYATGMELLYVYNSTFDSNSADSSGARGGAIYAGRDVELELELNRFIENSAHDGSAVACCGGSMREVQVIRSATADEGYGAVVSNEPGSEECSRSLVVTTSVFSQNEGGGLAIFNGDVKLESSSFTSNAGTAVYFETSDDAGHTFEMEDLTFTGNVDPASSWGSSEDAGEVGEQGSALVIRQAGQGDITSAASFHSVSCLNNEPNECEMVIEDGYGVAGLILECSLCDLEGTVLSVGSGALGILGESSSTAKVDRSLLIGLSACLSVILVCWAGLTVWVWRRWSAKKKKQETPSGMFLVPKPAFQGSMSRNFGNMDPGRLNARRPPAVSPSYIRSGPGRPPRGGLHNAPLTNRSSSSSMSAGSRGTYGGGFPQHKLGRRMGNGTEPRRGEEQKREGRSPYSWGPPSRTSRLEAVAEEKGELEGDDSSRSQKSQSSEANTPATVGSVGSVSTKQMGSPSGAWSEANEEQKTVHGADVSKAVPPTSGAVAQGSVDAIHNLICKSSAVSEHPSSDSGATADLAAGPVGDGGAGVGVENSRDAASMATRKSGNGFEGASRRQERQVPPSPDISRDAGGGISVGSISGNAINDESAGPPSDRLRLGQPGAEAGSGVARSGMGPASLAPQYPLAISGEGGVDGSADRTAASDAGMFGFAPTV